MAIEVGSNVSGKVTNITNFGAFVDLGNDQTGLVHISEVADHFVKDINDELSRGDIVTVKVLNIEDNGNIGLSLKQATPSPEDTASKPSTEEVKEERRQEPPRRQERRPNPAPRKPKKQNRGGDFDDLMSDFLKNSEERLSSLRRNTENKRGGRGGRRG